MTLRTILCPVDFSEHSRYALRWAVALAARFQGRVIVTTAVEPLLAQAARARLGRDLVKEDTEPALRDFVNATVPPDVSWAPGIQVEANVGDASDLVVETASRERADVIVMGTHGLGGVRKVLLGSTTERVLRRAQTPVLAVPLSEPPSVVFEKAGPRLDVKAVLAATDFSEAAQDALEYGAAIAGDLTIPLVLMHAVTPVAVPAQYRYYVEGVDEERTSEARRRLEQCAAGLRDSALVELVVSLGRPAESITSLARDRSAGLIVMGLTGQHDALSPRPGSIAYRVLCVTHVPVLVVPARAN